MRTGVFGGTFNPVHNGHIHLARTYFDALRLDRMLVIPTCLPPHKPGEQLADGADRLAMCRLAFDGLPGFEASDIELRRGQKSYTVDTLEQLAKEYPDDGFYLIMGSDMFLTLTGWREWRHLRRGAGHRAARPARRLQTLARGAGGALRAGRA